MSDEFQELRTLRDRLRDRSRDHWQSVTKFYDGSCSSFKLHAEESLNDIHLTTTATCLESLETCPPAFRSSQTDSELLDTLSTKFAEEAIETDQGSWKSDNSAQIYCRCRALPFVINNLDDNLLSNNKQDIETHIDHIFRQIEMAESRGKSRLSVGEAYVENKDEFERSDINDWYPPNGFHTYWCLKLLKTLKENDKELYDDLKSQFDLDHRRNLMIEWAWQELGTQVGLHEASSSTRDSDQLMWTIAIIAKFGNLTSMGLEKQDLIANALHCLFDNQEEVGRWRHQNPLFHYKKSGNAYSHVYEALNSIIEPAVQEELTFLQEELDKYRSNFARLLDYSDATAQSLDDGNPVWSSGHRTNDTRPEGWATANVFSFVQNLRQLVGQWTRDVALKELPTRSHESRPRAATKRLLDRGDTWCFDDEITVGKRLQKLFLNPIEPVESHEDPDTPPIPDDQARSAILFGPPGTSKTSMVRAIAEAIEWDYVEIHSSHFVADGLDDVQKRANEIFQQIGELDRCVVLFDEIDELVRAREEADVFGRFLTTSMLPRIGELWEKRRILYFVATNHIEYFDQAIIRGERFDAAIFVPPPAYEKKMERLCELLSSDEVDVSVDNIEVDKGEIENDFDQVLDKIEESEETHTDTDSENSRSGSTEADLDLENHRLAPFVILRWDELPELAVRLKKSCDDITSIDSGEFGEALANMQNQRFKRTKGYEPFLQQDRKRLDYGMQGTADLFE